MTALAIKKIGNPEMKKFTLLLSCIDRPGIVASVSSFLHQAGLNILESNYLVKLEKVIIYNI